MKANCFISLLKNISAGGKALEAKFTLTNLDLIVQEKNTSEMNKVYSQDLDVSSPSPRRKTRKPMVSQSAMQQIKRVREHKSI